MSDRAGCCGHGETVRPIAVGLALAALLVAWLTIAAPAWAQAEFRMDDQGWIPRRTLDPDSPEGQLQAIRRTIAQGDGKAAERLAKAWLKEHANHPLAVEGHLLQGDAKSLRRHYYRALYDYEVVIRQYPASEQFHVALEREFEIANLFSRGLRRRFLGMRWIPAHNEAEEIFIRIQERKPGSALGERASAELGEHYYRQGDMASAVEAYDMFLRNYPRSAFRERALLRLIEANLARFRGPDFDPTGLIDAINWIDQYTLEFPAAAERLGTTSLRVRIRESLAAKRISHADWRRRLGQRVSAVYLYQRVVREYPATSAAQVAREQLDDMGEPYAAPRPHLPEPRS